VLVLLARLAAKRSRCREKLPRVDRAFLCNIDLSTFSWAQLQIEKMAPKSKFADNGGPRRAGRRGAAAMPRG
jgi:hypothetical protein